MKYYHRDTESELKKLVAEGYSQLKIETLAEHAALKLSPMFQTFGMEWGDKVPGVYELKNRIFEYIVGAMANPAEDVWGTGGIQVEPCRWGESEEENDWFGLNIGFHLISADFEDLK